MGVGGCVMQWHPELKIGFGYVPFDFNVYDLTKVRASKLQKIVKKCVLKT